ncbi:MAG: glycosyltransferase family A protein, partial [Shimia sp.]
KVGDWARIEANLSRTLASLLRQSDPNWRAVVACHDVPTLPNDPRITALPIDRPLDGDDKWAKITAILRQEDPGPDLLLFPLDADDIVHPNLVAHMLMHPADGWIATEGYSLDARTGRLGRHAEGDPAYPRANPLWHACGSTGAVRMIAGDIEATRQMMVRHFEMPTMAADHGQNLRPLPFPAAIYLVAHGENMETIAGREADKLRYIEVNEIPENDAQAIRRIFDLLDGPLV